MSMSQLALTEIDHLPLSKVFNLTAIPQENEVVQLSDSSLLTSSRLLALSLKDQAQKVKEPLEEQLTRQANLVVFSTISLKVLKHLCSVCHISIQSINKVNERSGATSLQFSIHADDLALSRRNLASFNEANSIESAIVKQAPIFNQPGLLVMDMDSTAIKIECIDEIAKLAGTGEEVAAVTALAMQGKLDFKQSLYQRVATLKGADESILNQVLKNLPLMEGLTTLVSALQQQGWKLAIASGGFTYFADYLKESLPLDAAYSNQLEIVQGKLTGQVLGEIVDANKKAQILLSLAEKYQIPHSQTVAIGDGANDLVMMSKAGLGVACHGKEIVKQQAQTSVNKAPLDTLLHWLA